MPFGIDDAILLALSAASTVSGISSQNKNAKAAATASAQQNALNVKSQALAEKMNQQGLATQVDANGNITYYDASTNTWRTILAPQQKQINDAGNLELLRSLSIDAPLARGEALRASQARSQDSATASSLRQQMNDRVAGKGAVKASNIEGSLRNSRELAVSRGFDDIQAALTTQALRTGSGVQDIGAKLAKARSQQIAATMGNPELEGMQTARDMNATDLDNSINRYSTLQDRASATPGYTAPTNNISPTLTASLGSQRAAAANGTAQAGQLTNNIRVPNPVASPDYSSLFADIASVYNATGGFGGTAGKKKPSANPDWTSEGT